MNYRTTSNQKFTLPYNPNGTSIISNRDNNVPRAHYEKSRFPGYTSRNSDEYYSCRDHKEISNGVSVTSQTNYQNLAAHNSNIQESTMRKNSFSFNPKINPYNNFRTNISKEDQFQNRNFNFGKRLSFSESSSHFGAKEFNKDKFLSGMNHNTHVPNNTMIIYRNYLPQQTIHESNELIQHSKEGKLLMKNILKVNPSNKITNKQNKINQFRTKLQSIDISPYASTQVDDSNSSMCTTPNFETVNLSDLGQTPPFIKTCELRSKPKFKTGEIKRTCKIESFLNPLLFKQKTCEDETPLLEVDLKTPEGIFRLKITKTDNIAKTTKEFCIKNMIAEKFAEPITHLISKAINSLDTLLNSQVNKEYIEMLSNLCTLSKLHDTDEEGSTTLSENMSHPTVYDNNIENEDNEILNKTM